MELQDFICTFDELFKELNNQAKRQAQQKVLRGEIQQKDIHNIAQNNSRSTVIDHCNRVCDCWKASLNDHHDCQYLHVRTTFTNLILLQLFLKQSLPYCKIGDQIYNGNIAQAIQGSTITIKLPYVNTKNNVSGIIPFTL